MLLSGLNFREIFVLFSEGCVWLRGQPCYHRASILSIIRTVAFKCHLMYRKARYNHFFKRSEDL